jgi:four helix bundle protein
LKADNTIKDKSLDFAIRIVRLYKHISETNNEYILSKQLLKSGTSIGANVREAIGGQSKENFIAKMHIALKEAYETEYWLELLHSTDYLAENEFKSIFTDCRELTNILASILKTMKETK